MIIYLNDLQYCGTAPAWNSEPLWGNQGSRAFLHKKLSCNACCAKRSKVWIPWSYTKFNNIRSTIGKPVISKLDVKTDLDIDNVQKTYDFEFTGFPYSKRNCRCFLLNLNLSPEIEIMIIQRKYQIRLCTAGIMCLPFVSLSLDRKKTNDSWHYTWEGS